MQSAYSSAIERSTIAMNGVTVTFQHMMQYDLNSCKFPGRFPYGLEARLTQSGMKGKQEVISVSKGRNQGLCVVLDLIRKHDTE